MLKTLIKKDLLAFFSFFYLGKDGKRRKVLPIIGFALLMVYAVAGIGFVFWELADALCGVYVQLGISWVYFAFMGVMAAALCIITNLFMVKTMLYEAKDNELLLSMPIPPWKILFCRMASLYLFTLFTVVLVLIPTELVYIKTVGFSFAQTLCVLMISLLIPFGVLAICSLLGWVLAALTAKLRSKNLVTTVFLAVFLVGYFYGYSKLTDFLTYVTVNGEAVAGAMKTALYPFYQMGLGALGKAIPLLVFAVMCLGIFAAAYLLLAKTFIRLAIMKRSGKRATKKGFRFGKSTPVWTLFKKEAHRFFSNPMIVMNAMIGVIFYLAIPVILIVSSDFAEIFGLFGEKLSAIIIAGVLCAISTMNILSGVSITLEGDNLWQIKVMPVKAGTVFLVKIGFHLVMTLVPACICAISLFIATGLSFGYAVIVLCTVTAFIVTTALTGLAINLKFPSLHWTDEVMAIKQGVSVLICMLSEFATFVTFVIAYFAFGKRLPVWGFLGICTAVLVLIGALTALWLNKRGEKVFHRL